ncbi:MAG: branched-chain amino acid ABC transporter permease, partial [Ignavibacteria bacterium]
AVIGSNPLVVLVTTVVLMYILRIVVMKTRTGTAMRALSFNQTAASLMGININATISFTFIIGSSLAAAAGILYGLNYPSIDPLMGILPGIKAFVAAVLGGIGNIPGAALGGMIIGLLETFVVGYISPTYRDAIAFGILILILLFKPTGILGKKEVEKV